MRGWLPLSCSSCQLLAPTAWQSAIVPAPLAPSTGLLDRSPRTAGTAARNTKGREAVSRSCSGSGEALRLAAGACARPFAGGRLGLELTSSGCLRGCSDGVTSCEATMRCDIPGRAWPVFSCFLGSAAAAPELSAVPANDAAPARRSTQTHA